MPDDLTLDDLIDNAGLVRGLTYTPESARRTHALAIKLGSTQDAQLLRTLTLRERDFDEVFEEAIRAIAEKRGVTSRKLLDAMLDTRAAFMKYYGLSYKTVTHTTVDYNPERAEKNRLVKRIGKH
ncbi:hypothetical protein [Burkholderia vietnamiensis]|uniref:hypothetical protein n=1 Tax=Burkholderia vietnamiensis TaxID=60552 RepID=UPI001594354E|nr:hypothetical protein [Burkholderia vietnamiensis]MCA8198517.1 hypothetical protein [Burkholderia vietnamiensis]